jgi:flagellar hook-associated protein 1 FlgK
VTEFMTGGAIGGALDVINGKGPEFAASGENSFRGTLYYKAMLDTFAYNFAKELNQINYYDPNNLTGSQTDKDLFTTISGNGSITAASIRISQDWYADPLFLTVTQPSDQSPGENIGRMIALIERGVKFGAPPDPSGLAPTPSTQPPSGSPAVWPTPSNPIFEGTFEEYFSGLNVTLGLDVSLYTNYSTTSGQVMNTLFASRESVSGVSLEEEGTYLMTYQKSYNAAVRYFTVLDEVVDAIINKMGLAGR